MANVLSAGETNLFNWAGFGGRGRRIPWIPRPVPAFKWLPKRYSDYMVNWIPEVPAPHTPVKTYQPSYIERRFDQYRPTKFKTTYTTNNIIGLLPPTSLRMPHSPVSSNFIQMSPHPINPNLLQGISPPPVHPKFVQENNYVTGKNRDKFKEFVYQRKKLAKANSRTRINSKASSFDFYPVPPPYSEWQRKRHERNFETQWSGSPLFSQSLKDNFQQDHSSKSQADEAPAKSTLQEAPQQNKTQDSIIKNQSLTSDLLKNDDVIYIDRGRIVNHKRDDFPDFETSEETEQIEFTIETSVNFAVSNKLDFANDVNKEHLSPPKRSESSRGFWKSKVESVPLFSDNDLSTFPLFS